MMNKAIADSIIDVYGYLTMVNQTARGSKGFFLFIPSSVLAPLNCFEKGEPDAKDVKDFSDQIIK